MREKRGVATVPFCSGFIFSLIFDVTELFKVKSAFTDSSRSDVVWKNSQQQYYLYKQTLLGYLFLPDKLLWKLWVWNQNYMNTDKKNNIHLFIFFSYVHNILNYTT